MKFDAALEKRYEESYSAHSRERESANREADGFWLLPAPKGPCRITTPEALEEMLAPAGATLTVNQVREIRRRGRHESAAGLAREYGVNPGAVRDILHRRAWKWVIDSDDLTASATTHEGPAPGAVLTPTAVSAIRQRGRPNGRTAAKTLAQEYGVSTSAIYRVLRGETWPHITDDKEDTHDE